MERIAEENGGGVDELCPRRRSIKMDTPRPNTGKRHTICAPFRFGGGGGNGSALPVVVPMAGSGEEEGFEPKAKREIMHSLNQIQYTIRARYERSILVIRVCHMTTRKVFRNEFVQSDFPNKSIYAIAKTLIDGITKSMPISVHEYGQWCYLSLSGADIPSFALRPIKSADGGMIGSLV